jgi:hypothetical protein
MRNLITKARAAAAVAAILAGAAVSTVSVLPAAAKAVYPNVFLDDEHGVLTTPCAVVPGETLHGIGLVTGKYIITSVRPDGPVNLVTVSPALMPPQASEVLDFRS